MDGRAVRGDRRVADIYFTEFNRFWGHYSPPPHNYQDLFENTDWQKDYEPGDLRSKRVNQYVKMAI